jgi:hypothetical protein
MRITLTGVAIVIAALALTLLPVGRGRRSGDVAAARVGGAARVEIPFSIQREHRELHDELARAIRVGGKTGGAAEKVEKLLRPHLLKEEQYALPPLGMLRAFSGGEVPANAAEVLAMTERFRAEYPKMLEEHDAIFAAVGDLLVAARAEHQDDTAAFARELSRHAETEEEILYPTTVLIGEYLKVSLARDGHAARAAALHP